uniref:hypothetical protein n=1 Tax=Backusella lamprospora TaxID=64654 RepID=UPI002E79F0F3|nr:hypothetical protein V2394_mgp01 [Backusella lamprospora]WPR14055.1 hypothetical protein [Backusella lamprospora]
MKGLVFTYPPPMHMRGYQKRRPWSGRCMKGEKKRGEGREKRPGPFFLDQRRARERGAKKGQSPEEGAKPPTWRPKKGGLRPPFFSPFFGLQRIFIGPCPPSGLFRTQRICFLRASPFPL